MRPPPRATLLPYTTLFRSMSVETAQYRRARSAAESTFSFDTRAVLTHLERRRNPRCARADCGAAGARQVTSPGTGRSEEHTSELQSRLHLVCRLRLEKKTS